MTGLSHPLFSLRTLILSARMVVSLIEKDAYRRSIGVDTHRIIVFLWSASDVHHDHHHHRTRRDIGSFNVFELDFTVTWTLDERRKMDACHNAYRFNRHTRILVDRLTFRSLDDFSGETRSIQDD